MKKTINKNIEVCPTCKHTKTTEEYEYECDYCKKVITEEQYNKNRQRPYWFLNLPKYESIDFCCFEHAFLYMLNNPPENSKYRMVLTKEQHKEFVDMITAKYPKLMK